MALVVQLTDRRNQAIERQLANCMKEIQRMLADEKRNKKKPAKTQVVLHTAH